MRPALFAITVVAVLALAACLRTPPSTTTTGGVIHEFGRFLSPNGRLLLHLFKQEASLVFYAVKRNWEGAKAP